MNNLACGSVKATNYDFLLAMEQAQRVLADEKIIADDRVRDLPQLFDLLIKFPSTRSCMISLSFPVEEGLRSHVRAAYDLLLYSEPAIRGNRLYLLYETVIASEAETLRAIHDAKLHNARTDQELEPECRHTGLYFLFSLPDDALALSGAELAQLKGAHPELEKAIGLIHGQRSCAMRA